MSDKKPLDVATLQAVGYAWTNLGDEDFARWLRRAAAPYPVLTPSFDEDDSAERTPKQDGEHAD